MSYTEEQKTEVVKNLAQYLVSKYMTGSEEFITAIEVFDIQVIQQYDSPTLDGRVWYARVFNKQTPDGNLFTFKTEKERAAFVAQNS